MSALLASPIGDTAGKVLGKAVVGFAGAFGAAGNRQMGDQTDAVKEKDARKDAHQGKGEKKGDDSSPVVWLAFLQGKSEIGDINLILHLPNDDEDDDQ
jgi:hypothetical protein